MSQKFPKTATRFLVALAPLLLVLAACGDSDDVSSSDTAASTETDIPRLTFDGSTCVYEGPVEVTAGVVVVEFVNDSDGTSNVFVGLFDEGKTIQDLAEFRGLDELEPGEPLPPGNKPNWVIDMGAQRPASAGDTLRWEANLAAGQYVASCLGNREAFFGSGFTVVNG